MHPIATLAFALALSSPAAALQEKPPTTFSEAQLEQIVAPIALYADDLLAQILMASTYPIEVVQAARWAEKRKGLTGEKLEAELKNETWDPAVKALCGLPDVLKRMNDNLDWTQDLGDAFLGQKAALMAAVQTMRRKAYDEGNLKSGKEQTVTEESDTIIVIESTDPEVVYVPTYYPTSVYGSWGYPVYYYPPLYPPPPAGGMFFGFTAGVIWGAAIWGDCDWGHSDIDIDVDHHNTFVDRTEVDARKNQLKKDGATGGRFQHDASHRKGVAYKNDAVAKQYGAKPGATRVPRDQARGYGDRAGTPAPAARDAAARPAAGETRKTTTASSRQAGEKSGSYSGARNPSQDRAAGSRGSASRGSAGSRGAARGGGRGRR